MTKRYVARPSVLGLSDFSIYGTALEFGQDAWVIETYYYVRGRDEVSVKSLILQMDSLEPSVFQTEEAALAAAKKFFAEGNTSLEVIGFSAKKITLLKKIK